MVVLIPSSYHSLSIDRLGGFAALRVKRAEAGSAAND
jgi:hypothetical protein